MASRYIQNRVIKELYAKSGNCCAFPNCQCSLFFEEANISEICHIQGLNPDSARYNPKLSDAEANQIENLILLCSNHHSLVDQNEDKYTVATLKQMKAAHELQVAQLLSSPPQKSFEIELQRIFQECSFDVIFLQQNFESLFPDCFFMKADEGYLRIRELLNDECALHISAKCRKELYSFSQLIEYVMQGVAMNTFPNGNGFAIPRYNSQDLAATQENLKALQEIYIKYRFN